MSAGARRALAPPTIRMRFSPLGSTKIGATPLAASATWATWRVSTPQAAKLASVSRPNASSPRRATIITSAPSRAAATAWLAPLPPNPVVKLSAAKVSPRSGIRST